MPICAVGLSESFEPCLSFYSSSHLPTEYLASCIITMAPSVPYCHQFLTPLKAGDEIKIKGVFAVNNPTLEVKLLRANDRRADALLIFEIDSTENVKLYYTISGARGDAIVIPHIYWQTDPEFELLIEMNGHFKITINNQYSTSFPYKFALDTVKYLCIDGDINLSSVALPDI